MNSDRKRNSEEHDRLIIRGLSSLCPSKREPHVEGNVIHFKSENWISLFTSQTSCSASSAAASWLWKRRLNFALKCRRLPVESLSLCLGCVFSHSLFSVDHFYHWHVSCKVSLCFFKLFPPPWSWISTLILLIDVTNRSKVCKPPNTCCFTDG